MNDASEISTNYVFLITSSFVCTFLVVLILYYVFKLRQAAAPILSILALLLVNELFESFFQMANYVQGIDTMACQIGLIGKTAFTIAANYWIFFITRLIYRERLAPGKYLDISVFVSKNLFYTYLPSVVVSVFLMIIINVVDTKSQMNCWKVIVNRELADYVIYLTAFILPNFIALLAIFIYLWLYFRLKSGTHSFFLIYPIISTFFNCYYIGIKLYLFLEGVEITDNLQIPFIIQPLAYGLIFIYIKQRLEKKRPKSAQLTIKDESQTDSFLDL